MNQLKENINGSWGFGFHPMRHLSNRPWRMYLPNGFKSVVLKILIYERKSSLKIWNWYNLAPFLRPSPKMRPRSFPTCKNDRNCIGIFWNLFISIVGFVCLKTLRTPQRQSSMRQGKIVDVFFNFSGIFVLGVFSNKTQKYGFSVDFAEFWAKH